MNPVLYLAGAVLPLGALGVSLLAIYTTIVPSLPKIGRALGGTGSL